MAGRILVGTASWTDPGFVADWYPKGWPASERLSWYAEHFNFVELNSSFYAIPNHRQVERWCRQTPQGFVFDVKLHRLLSRHATVPSMLPSDLRKQGQTKGAQVLLTPALERAVAGRFLEEIEPFLQHKKFGALLLQLSPSFSPKAHRLTELDGLLEQLQSYPVAVELRHRGWVENGQFKETVEFFRRRRITLVGVDSPRDPHFMIMPGMDWVTHTQLAYLRAHGRDASRYISGRTVAERFHYEYSDEELEEIAKRVTTLAAEAAEVHVVFNNNAHDYAPRDATRLLKLMLKRFPQAARQLSLPAEWQATARAERAPKQQIFSFNIL
jgi:uncharacterized protein YecE (DUF72 family)